jgi:hypothetical protein
MPRVLVELIARFATFTSGPDALRWSAGGSNGAGGTGPGRLALLSQSPGSYRRRGVDDIHR